MTRRIGLVIIGLLFVGEAHGQIRIGVGCCSGGLLGFRHVGSRGFFSFSIGGPRPIFSPFYHSIPYIAPTFRQTTIIYTPPVVVARPVVIAEPVPLIPAPPPLPPFVNDQLARDILPPAFLEGRIPPEVVVPRPPPAEQPPLPPGPFDRPPVAKIPRPPMPEPPRDIPWAEYVRLLDLGKKAMAGAEYGRAAEHFGRAVGLLPKEPEAYFSLMQAQIALGKYFEALDNLRAGLTRKPNWPEQPVAPRDLYGANAIEYPDHLARLEETTRRLANEMGLQFLHATQLWLDGKTDDARKVFEPLRMGPDREFVEMFLRIKPAGVL